MHSKGCPNIFNFEKFFLKKSGNLKGYEQTGEFSDVLKISAKFLSKNCWDTQYKYTVSVQARKHLFFFLLSLNKQCQECIGTNSFLFTVIVAILPINLHLFYFQVGDYSVSLKAPGRNKHFRVHVEGTMFCIGQRKFNTMQQLVEHYQRAPIYTSQKGEKLFLIRPLPK